MPTSFTAEFLIIARPTGEKISLLAQQFKLTPEQIEMCIQVDPSPNQTDFVTWIARMFSKQKIRLPEDGAGLRANLSAFQTQRRQPGFVGSKDINAYDPAKLSDTIEANAMTVIRPKDMEKMKGLEGTQILAQRGDITIFKTTNAEALATLSDSTRWCTRHGEEGGRAQYYIEKGPSYVVFYRGKPYGQLHPSTDQYMNRKDEPFAKEYREEGTKVDAPAYGRGWRRRRRTEWREGEVIGMGVADPVALEALKMMQEKDPIVDKWAKDKNLADPKILAKRLKGTKYWLDAAILEGVPLTPEEEQTLSNQGPDELRPYANKFYPGQRWAPLEQSILRNIGNNTDEAIKYAADHIKGRWPELEPLLLHSVAISDWYAGKALTYAMTAIKGRWPELEKKFLTTKSKDTMPKLAAKYAIEVLKQPWSAVVKQVPSFGITKPEELMCRNAPKEAIEYAEAFNLKPWPAFAQILLSTKQVDWYIEYLAKLDNRTRDPKLEQRLLSPVPEVDKVQVPLNDQDRRAYRREHGWESTPPKTKEEEKTLYKDGMADFYAKEVIGGRWPELEEKLLREVMDEKSALLPEEFHGLENNDYRSDNVPDPFEKYIKWVMKGRWPEFEQALLQRYQDYPNTWKTNQSLVAGYLTLVQAILGKSPAEREDVEPSPITGIWSEGEAILKQRSAGYEAQLMALANKGLEMPEIPYRKPGKNEPAYPKDERGNALWWAGDQMKDYILFLRDHGNDWPEGVVVLNHIEDIRDAHRKEVEAAGGYATGLRNRLEPPKEEEPEAPEATEGTDILASHHYGSLLDRLESHTLLRRKRIQPL
jgi:hypothetical protein